ncbi:MAG: 6-phosphogluconolactonase [bacterium]
MTSLQVFRAENAAENAQNAAKFVSQCAADAIADRGAFHVAFSGGETPDVMFASLQSAALDWSCVHVYQVDERMAPTGSDQNFVHLDQTLLRAIPLPASNIHRIDPTLAPEAAREGYERLLHECLGDLPVLDLVHLGLGSDGHTASLVPKDPVLRSTRDVGLTDVYKGYRRVTMTYAILNRARQRLWLVSGHEKREMLAALILGNAPIPANGINRHAVAFADAASLEKIA